MPFEPMVRTTDVIQLHYPLGESFNGLKQFIYTQESLEANAGLLGMETGVFRLIDPCTGKFTESQFLGVSPGTGLGAGGAIQREVGVFKGDAPSNLSNFTIGFDAFLSGFDATFTTSGNLFIDDSLIPEDEGATFSKGGGLGFGGGISANLSFSFFEVGGKVSSEELRTLREKSGLECVCQQ